MPPEASLALSAGNIIFDEAHNLEKIAASYLGNVVDKRALDAILSDMYASRPAQSGFLPNLRASLLYRSGDDDLIPLIDSVIDGVIKANYAASHFFETVKIQSPTGNDEAREIPYNSEKNPCDIEERDELIASLKLLTRKNGGILSKRRGNGRSCLSGAKTLFDWRHLRPISPILEALRLMSFMPLTMSTSTGLKSQPRHGRLHVSFRPLSMWESFSIRNSTIISREPSSLPPR